MRRSTRVGLAIAILAVVVCGAYTAYWWTAASRIKAGLDQWAAALHAQNLDLSWRTARVVGYPFAFRLELAGARLRDRNAGALSEVRLPLLSASASPWNFRVFQLAAPDGLSADSGGDAAFVKLSAHAAEGSIVVPSAGGATLWFGISQPSAEAGLRLAARRLDLWLILPPHPPHGDTGRALGIGVEARDLALPIVPAPFRNPLDEVSFGLTVRGPLPLTPLRQAAAAWRDAGGTADLDHFALRWGTVAITGSGTLALDSDLQPIGGFSGAIEGYPQLMSALVAAGRLRVGDARLAGLALAMLSRAGPDGRPQIATSFTIQNGQMYLGPAKLGPAPRIAWK